MSQLQELIFKYFDDGFWCKGTLQLLDFFNVFNPSVSNLNRILTRNNKKRRVLKMFTTRTF